MIAAQSGFARSIHSRAREEHQPARLTRRSDKSLGEFHAGPFKRGLQRAITAGNRQA